MKMLDCVGKYQCDSSLVAPVLALPLCCVLVEEPNQRANQLTYTKSVESIALADAIALIQSVQYAIAACSSQSSLSS